MVILILYPPATDWCAARFVPQFKCTVQHLIQVNGGCSLSSHTILYILIELKPEWELPYYSWSPHFLIIYCDIVIVQSSTPWRSKVHALPRVISLPPWTSLMRINESKKKEKELGRQPLHTLSATVLYCTEHRHDIDMWLLMCPLETASSDITTISQILN